MPNPSELNGRSSLRVDYPLWIFAAIVGLGLGGLPFTGGALAKLAVAAHATIVLLPRFEARAYIEAIGQYRPTWLTAVPPMIARSSEYCRSPCSSRKPVKVDSR